jgi:hypothetical protein
MTDDIDDIDDIDDMTTLGHFNKNNFAVIPDLLDPMLVTFLSSYYANMKDSKDEHFGSDWTSLNGAGDACADAVMYMIREKIEEKVGMELVPGFSFVRIYKKGDSVGRHIDRGANEVNTSTTITMDADWPIEFQHKFGGERFLLGNKPGTGVAFRGMEMEHWRHKYTGESQVQLIAGYVIKGGEYDKPQYCFDGRGGPLYTPSYSKRASTHTVIKSHFLKGLRRLLKGGKIYVALKNLSKRFKKT